MGKAVVGNGSGVKRCEHLIGVGGLDNDNVDRGTYGWLHCC